MKGCGLKVYGLTSIVLEAEIGFQPLVIARHSLRRDEDRQFFQIFELADALIGMREQHLRVLLEHGGDVDDRHILRDGVEALQRVGAHEEIELADGHQHAVIGVRAARYDGHVEAVFPVGAVGQRLVEAAVLGLGHPVGAESDFVERFRARRPHPCRGKGG